MAMKDDPHAADSYYLLHVMRRQCQGEVKDWKKLVSECMHDKELFGQVKLEIATRLGCAGVIETPKYPD